MGTVYIPRLLLVGGSSEMNKASGLHVLLKVRIDKTAPMLRTAVVSCTQATVAFFNTCTRWVRIPVAESQLQSAQRHKQLCPSARTRFWGHMQIVRSMVTMATGSSCAAAVDTGVLALTLSTASSPSAEAREGPMAPAVRPSPLLS